MDSEQDNSADDVQNTGADGVGARLRAARETLRLDLAHIAAETRIPLRHLVAIEDGNFEALPSRAYAIGFSRTFARAVGLDEVAITDAVSMELADGSMRRAAPAPGMEPGDPARLPSAGLAWFGAFAALLLAVGAIAFYNSQFGAGTEPDTSLAPAPLATPSPAARPDPASTASATSGEVVLTAMQDGVWVRLYEEGGDRLFERTLTRGETVTVPTAAADPRINTGRPDALAITVSGRPVAKLANRPTTLSGTPVSAAALLARATPTPETAAVTTNPAAAPFARPAAGGVSPADPARSGAPQATGTVADPMSASAPDTPVSSETPRN